jgi:hypothetical protein
LLSIWEPRDVMRLQELVEARQDALRRDGGG